MDRLAEPGLTSAHNKAVAEFVCNICSGKNAYSGEPFERETPSCGSCGSTLRARALIGALSMELFGIQLSLADFPRVKSWRGLGTSDSREYAKRLAEVFDYRNTFYDREPRFDLGKLDPGDPSQQPNQYDFLLSSEVIEHIAPPINEAFRNAYSLLKPHGVLVFTVPYRLATPTEHFPDLHEYGLAEVGNRIVLVNRTLAGEIQVREDLSFHRSGSEKALEMRVFSEEMLRNALAEAGFSSVKVHAGNYRPFGIVPVESWSLPITARKGPFACNIDAMRDVMEEWRNLRKRLARSTWYRVGRRLGLLRGDAG
jgi:SAM-dependent methyltransferase